uniref:CAP-Gly domain-containing protein n=1 Tax=Amphimedon queenslandica TaxID=400682 RepID=A0A1X7THA7_AMPQE
MIFITLCVFRPVSAPAVQFDDLYEEERDMLSLSYHYPLSTPPTHHHTLTTGPCNNGGINRRSIIKKKGHIKAKSVPRLPPIGRSRPDFRIVTSKDVKQRYKEVDCLIKKKLNNDSCDCEVCAANRGEIKRPDYLPGLTGKTGLERLREEADRREEELAKQLKLGQRVLVQVKKSMYDLEPQKLTGVIKYIGKVDKEYVDNRIYVGVKLDEPAGNMNGIYKGKRYFECSAGHGRMLHITNVLAAMPRQVITTLLYYY